MALKAAPPTTAQPRLRDEDVFVTALSQFLAADGEI
jgi:hypothetical protein